FPLMNQSGFPGAIFRLLFRSCPAAFALIALSTASPAAQTSGNQPNGNAWGRGGTPKPIAAWSFAQTDGTFVPDSSGHGYDATVYGAPVLEPTWGKNVALVF